MLKKPLIAGIALAALAGCATSVPTSTHAQAPAPRSVAAVAPHFTQKDLTAMRALIPARLTPEQAKADLVRLPADKIKDANRSVKWYGGFGYYPYSYGGYASYWPYYSYGSYFYPYSYYGYGGYYPFYSYGSYYYPYSYGWW